MRDIPFLGSDAILELMRKDGAYLLYDGIGWLLFNAVDEAAGATSSDVVEDLHHRRLIAWEAHTPTRAGVRWIATQEPVRISEDLVGLIDSPRTERGAA